MIDKDPQNGGHDSLEMNYRKKSEYKASEFMKMPVIAALHKSQRIVRELQLQDQDFPAVVISNDLLQDPAFLRFKRLTWEASLRKAYKTDELVIMGIQSETRDWTDQDSPTTALAKWILKDYNNNPGAFKDWMN